MSRYEGLVAASVTPFDQHRCPDLGAVERLMDYYAQNGFTGAFVLSSTGEFFATCPAKRKEIASCAAKCADRCILVFSGVSEDYLEGVYRNIDDMAQAGVDAVMLMPPRFSAYDQSELIDFYVSAADYAPMPLFIYNHMVRLNNKLTVDTVVTLSDHPNIHGIKDTHNDHARLTQVLSRLGGREDFTVYSGGDGIAGLTTLMGGSLLNALSAVCPQLFLDMLAAGRQRDVKRVMALQNKVTLLMGLFNVVGGGQYTGTSVFSQGIKCAMALKGLCGTTQAQLGFSVTQEDMDRVRQVLAKVES